MKGLYFYRKAQIHRATKLHRLRIARKTKGTKQTRKRSVKLLDENEILCKKFPGYKHVKAPKIFSITKNRLEVLHFLEQLKQCREKKKKTLVRLDGVEELSTDAILVLLSSMVHFQVERVEFNGTRPKDPTIHQKLADSGFFIQLYQKSHILKEQYSFKKITGCLYTHGQKAFDSELADNLVKHASETVWGEARRCPGIHKTLLELMHNTYDHAGLTKGDQHWWVSVEHDPTNKEVTFAFIDFGVGIFRSLANKGPHEPLYGAMDLIRQKFPGVTKDVEKLRLILEGKVQLSQSNIYYRGKGLAKIYDHFLNDKIASLFIMSNHAFVDAEKQEFSTLKEEFIGTFISFKIKQNIYTLPWQIY